MLAPHFWTELGNLLDSAGFSKVLIVSSPPNILIWHRGPHGFAEGGEIGDFGRYSVGSLKRLRLLVELLPSFEEVAEVAVVSSIPGCFAG